MKIVILGGGISGLSAAWYLRKRHPGAEIVLLEKQARLGGWLESEKKEGYFFEKGPRTFMASRSASLLELIEEVGLKDEIISSEPSASKRFLWHEGRLRSVGSLIPRMLPALIREPFVRRREVEDESIYDFASRRFGRRVAETIFDPMTLGIFAGDIRNLSIRSCFPVLAELEKEKGSVIRGMLFRKKKKGPRGLFTLQRGMGSLVDAIARRVPVDIRVNAPVVSIENGGVYTQERFWEADWVVSALPGLAIGRLTRLWPDFPTASMWVVSFAFPEGAFQKKGFGYLVPTKEKEPLLGVVWDSAVFPQQQKNREVRMTAMVRDFGDAAWAEKTALDALKRHLGIKDEPLFSEPHYALDAIPQFEVGYGKRLKEFQAQTREKYPKLILAGNFLSGASVESCVRSGHEVVDRLDELAAAHRLG